MQKVGVLAESVAIFVDVADELALALEVIIPLFRAVVRPGPLKAIQDAFVVVRDPCQLLDPDGPVQRVVRVESARVRFRLVSDVHRPHDVLRRFQIDLKHFSQQNPVLILNLAHTLYLK